MLTVLVKVAADYKPPKAATPIHSPPPTKTEAPKHTPAPEPVARGPPPSVNDNKASLASQASKFADKDEESSEDETSSFEEVPKPVERHTVTAARQELKTGGPSATKQHEPPKPTPTPAAAPARSPATSSEPTPTASTPAPSASGAASVLKDALADIKATLHHQNQVMSDQSDQIALLMREVSQLKVKLGQQSSDREKDERIRQLELELEEARS